VPVHVNRAAGSTAPFNRRKALVILVVARSVQLSLGSITPPAWAAPPFAATVCVSSHARAVNPRGGIQGGAAARTALGLVTVGRHWSLRVLGSTNKHCCWSAGWGALHQLQCHRWLKWQQCRYLKVEEVVLGRTRLKGSVLWQRMGAWDHGTWCSCQVRNVAGESLCIKPWHTDTHLAHLK